MPIFADDGEFRGVVLFTIIVSDLISGLGEHNPVNGTSWVIDSQGNIIFHPRYKTGTTFHDAPTVDDSFRTFLGMATAGESGMGEYTSPEGKRTIASCHPIAVADEIWSYVVASDEKAARDLLVHITVDYGLLTATAFLVILIGSATILWRFSMWNRELESIVKSRTEDLERSRARLQSLATELVMTEGRERCHIATDLHDRIGQTLAAVRIRLGTVRDAVTMSAELAERLEEARTLIKETIEETRSLSFELCPPVLREFGFEAAVEWLAEEMEEQHGIPIEVADDGLAKPVDGDHRNLLFRALRELLVNVVKHARAQRVRVDIRKADDTIRVTVEDDGIGFDPSVIGSRWSKQGGFGLFGMRERLIFSGGRLEIDSEPGRGTRATVVSPLGSAPCPVGGEAP